MIRALVILAALSVLLPGAAHADPAAALERLGLSGSVALDYFTSDHDIDDRDNFPGLNLVLKHRLKLGSGMRWVAEARVLAEQVGHEHEDATHGLPRSVRYADEVTSELREGYVEISRSLWEMRVGRQIIPWGRGDEINPTDVFTP